MLRFLRPGWLVIYAIILFVIFGSGGWSFTFDAPLEIEEWDSLYKIVDDQSSLDKLKFKWFLRKNDIDVSSLQVWSYDEVVWEVSFSDFVWKLGWWPSTEIVKVTLLEWWSTYDIDTYLSWKWYASAGEYLDYVWNRDAIRNDFEQRGRYANGNRSQDYAFLSEKRLDQWLEGVLYPDTYHLDRNYPLIPQLVRLQLQSFGSQIYADLPNNSNGLDWYELLVLASVIEKEERVDANRDDIAGVFYNRLDLWMRIDADISLCYGLKKGYEDCTPDVIVANLRDDQNPYNTRAVWWLPPTPIVTPTKSSVDSVIKPLKHDYLFYLHDMDGRIHLSETLAEHNQKKNTYLR